MTDRALTLPSHLVAGADLRGLQQQVREHLLGLTREVLLRDLARLFDTVPGLTALRLCFRGNLPLTSAVQPVWCSLATADAPLAFETALEDLARRLKPSDAPFVDVDHLAIWLRSPPDPLQPRAGWGYVTGPASAFLVQMAPDLVEWDRSQARSSVLATTPASGAPPRRRRS